VSSGPKYQVLCRYLATFQRNILPSSSGHDLNLEDVLKRWSNPCYVARKIFTNMLEDHIASFFKVKALNALTKC
jgi:hypothetical protein